MGGLLISGCSSDSRKKSSTEAQAASGKEAGPQELLEKATFTDLQGNKVGIQRFKGKLLIVDFWETWCGPCLQTFPTLQDLVEEYPNRFAVLAVTPGFMDKPEDTRKFVRKNDYNFTFVRDTDSLAADLGIQSIPYKVFVGPDGNYIRTQIGSRGPEKDYEEIRSLIKEYTKSNI